MKHPLILTLLALGLAPSLTAQATALRMAATVGGITQTLSNGGFVQLPSDAQPAAAILSLWNAGTGTILISQISVSGSAFTIANIPAMPVLIGPNQRLFYSVSYPVGGTGSSTGLLKVAYSEANLARSFDLTLIGQSPDHTFSVATPENRRAISPAGRITFPATRPGGSRTYSLIVMNRGSAPGLVRSVSITGASFSTTVTGVLTIAAGGEVAIPITFEPLNTGSIKGEITLDFPAGRATFVLEGLAAAPEFTAAYMLPSDGSMKPLSSNAVIGFSSIPALTAAKAEVTITNSGGSAGAINSITVAGEGFRLPDTLVLPATILPGQVFRFSVGFNPHRTGAYSGSLRIELDGRVITSILDGTTSEPSFELSYADASDRPVNASNKTLSFSETTPGNSSVYSVTLHNRGEGTGFLNTIALTGGAFQLVDPPALPTPVLPDSTVRFHVRFTPKAREMFTGSLQIGLSGGILTLSLMGQGIGPELVYEISSDGDSFLPLVTASEISFTCAVGQTVSKAIRITNNGNGHASFSALSVTGAGFKIADAPLLPLTIPVGGSRTITIEFTAAEAGVSHGRLLSADQTFDFTATVVAPRLDFAYQNDAGITRISEDPIVFKPVRVGDSARVSLLIHNAGTAPVIISSVDMTPVSNVFAIDDVSALPVKLDPGSTVAFGVRFTPSSLGLLTGILRVNNRVPLTLVGVGREPIPLPQWTIESSEASGIPMRQPALQLTLASPYTLPIRGTLTLTFESEVFNENPAVLFATGGRTVNFTIPANSTRAVFGIGAKEVRFQTGTIAGTIHVLPTFATATGLDLTPELAEGWSQTISRDVPRLLAGEITDTKENTLLLLVTGFCTTRQLLEVDVELTPRGDQKFSNTVLKLNLESASLQWFHSTHSSFLGGLFTMMLPVKLQRGATPEDLTRYVESIAVRVSNDLGRSTPLVVAVN